MYEIITDNNVIMSYNINYIDIAIIKQIFC